jgi:hypothetical protein
VTAGMKNINRTGHHPKIKMDSQVSKDMKINNMMFLPKEQYTTPGS